MIFWSNLEPFCAFSQKKKTTFSSKNVILKRWHSNFINKKKKKKIEWSWKKSPGKKANVQRLCYSTGFNLSFWSAVVKIYPFVTLCWMNKDKNIYPNKLAQPIPAHSNTFLNVAENRFIAWSYFFSGTPGISLNSAILTVE